MIPGDQPGPGQPPGSHLSPPGTPSGPGSSNTGKHGVIWIALAVVVLLGLGVLFVLPNMVSTGVDESQSAAGDEKPGVVQQTIETEEQDEVVSRSDAARALQEFLMTRARLELANAPVWGEPQWSQALEGAAKGDELFGKRQFAASLKQFTESTALLTALESESGLRLATALETGWNELERNESDAAIAQFEVAIAIEASNEEAQMGLERSRVRPELLSLVDAGDLALAMKNLPEAQAAYFKAVELDGLYGPAQTALQDVTAQIIDQEFKLAMSTALNALQNQQPKTAEQALKQASSLKPGEEVIANARYELEQLKQKLWLEDQRSNARSFGSRENWAAAVRTYQGIIARVPQAAFARQGLEEAQDRARLHQQLDHYLDEPGRVYAAQPRANATKLLTSVGKPPAGEPLLAEKTAKLQALITLANEPQVVTIQSDGLTNVVIYHVGRLGSFTNHQLELLPGTYTVVGSRPGYRDVRRKITVKPGAGETSVVIQCEEAV